MKLSNKVYDILKMIITKVLPAAITAIEALGILYSFETKYIVGTIAIIMTFIGAVMGISTKKYNEENDLPVQPEDDEE